MRVECPHCQANLVGTGKSGATLLRGRGLLLKASGLATVCPRCKKDVPLSLDMMKSIQQRIVVFFERKG